MPAKSEVIGTIIHPGGVRPRIRASLSSKRLCGFIGWLCCAAVLIMCTIWDRQAPQMVSTVLYMSTALLGMDSVTDIWKTDANKHINNTSSNEK